MTEASSARSARASSTPVRDGTLTLNGLRFHYRDWGSPQALPLVLLHGFTSNARHWDTLAQAMAERYRVVALDQRGHGETDWAPDGDYMAHRVNEDFRAFVEALGLERFDAVGFSFGGQVAYTYAAEHPDRVGRLVLVECGTPPTTPAFRAHMRALQSIQAVFDDPDEAVSAFKAARFAPYAPEDELQHWVRTGLKQQPDGRWTWRLDPVFRVPSPDRPRLVQPAAVASSLLPRVTCPTLLVRGAETVAFLLEIAEQMAAAMPNARVVSIPRAGHWTTLDNPTGFVQVVRDFLTKHSSPPDG
jgi:pimeloyl-ACP methyl ester carboxylesterase